MQKYLSGLLAISILSMQCLWLPSYSHEVSKAGEIFEQVKDGVVTIFTSAGHGSGFLMDNSGLIVTNSHVVKEAENDLRVKFGPNEIVAGKVIENDRENDVAIVQVNLENVKNYKVLSAFVPQQGDTLVLVGENVLAIGSPLDRENLEKTLTTGVVGKYDHDVISDDVDINPGNSGGPLINYDAQVVGINTFVEQVERGQGISGAVPITKALPILEKAKQETATADKPSSELLPDVPDTPFPISELLKQNPNLFPKRGLRDYNFQASYFNVSVLTPPQGYRQITKLQDQELAKRKKRAQKKGFEVTDDEYDYKNIKYYDYNKPLVTFFVIPKPKLTTGSKIFDTVAFVGAVGLTAATFGVGAPAMVVPFMMGKKEVKKDFLSMNLVTPDGKVACTPVETGRVPFEKSLVAITSYTYEDFIDKSYIGVYSYDAKCFDNPQPLTINIDIEGTKDKDYSIHIPDRIKNIVVEDFKPYNDYVVALKKPKNDAVVASKSASTDPSKETDALKKIIDSNSTKASTHEGASGSQ